MSEITSEELGNIPHKICLCGKVATNGLPTKDGTVWLCDDCNEHWEDFAEKE